MMHLAFAVSPCDSQRCSQSLGLLSLEVTGDEHFARVLQSSWSARAVSFVCFLQLASKGLKAPRDPHELFHLLFLGNLSVYDYLFESIYSVMVIGPSVSSR